MLFIAIFSFVIGQFIDITRHIKTFILSIIVVLMIFKVLIASYNDQKTYEGSHFIRVRLSFEIFRMALFFTCSVSLFNWYPRKYLLIIISLFDLNGVFALILTWIYQYDDDFDYVAQKICGIISDIILAFLLYFIWKYYYVDPVDDGIVINE